jgi:hypothetical protein
VVSASVLSEAVTTNGEGRTAKFFLTIRLTSERSNPMSAKQTVESTPNQTPETPGHPEEDEGRDEPSRIPPTQKGDSSGFLRRGGLPKLSLQIALLLEAHERGLLWEFGGLRRLLRLELRLSPEALIASQKRLEDLKDPDVRLSFERLWSQHGSRLNSYVRPRPLQRIPEKRRIGVGYRDKGSPPLGSSIQIVQANQEAWIYGMDIPLYLFFRPGFNSLLEWVDDWVRVDSSLSILQRE